MPKQEVTEEVRRTRIKTEERSSGATNGVDAAARDGPRSGSRHNEFAIPVPKTFGAAELTWTIVANGQTNTITMHARPDWIVEPFEDPGNKNTRP